jgi:hypothetical protein
MANEEHFRQFWEKTKQEIDETALRTVHAQEGTHTAAELIPVLIDTIERAHDFGSRTWSAPQVTKLFFKKEKSPLSTTPLPPFGTTPCPDGAGGLYQKK